MVERMDLFGKDIEYDTQSFKVSLENLRKYVNIERYGKKVTIEFLGATARNGEKALFTLRMKDTRNFTFKEVYHAWLEQWPRKKQEKLLGKGAVMAFMEGNGKPYVLYKEQIGETEKFVGANGNIGTERITGLIMDKDIIFNPKEEKIKNLYGKRVLATDCAWDFDNTQVKGTLVSIVTDMAQSQGKPFVVELKDGTQQNFFCIKEQPEPTFQPYKLANSEVRDKLMLKVYKSKDAKTYVEQMIHTFKCTGGSWTVNGMSAAHLLQNYTWLDGSPCGELPEE